MNVSKTDTRYEAEGPAITPENEKKKSYDIVFVGLVCFLKRDREALMPDGRAPREHDVARHFPYIVVNVPAVREQKGWEGETDEVVMAFAKEGIFRLPKCRIEISGASTPGKLDADQHDRFVPKLIESDPAVVVDPGTANAIVRMKIGSGTLEALRVPNADPKEDDVAIVSRLRVEHEGPIRIDIFGENEKEPRVLVLEPGTDLALANIELPREAEKTGNHFTLYGELTESGTIRGPRRVSPRVPCISDHYTIFQLGLPIQDAKTPCGSQGCCPPPP